MNNIFIKSDIDLLDAICMRKRPVDRIRQADVIPYYKGLLPIIKGKVIVVNRYLEGELPNIKELAQNNTIINRVPEYEKELGYQKYPDVDIISYSNESVSIEDIQKGKVDVRLISIDDLLISNKAITFN